MTIENRLNKARADYQQKLLDRLEALGTLIGRLRDGEHDLDLDTAHEAQRLAHRIYGSAGTFGFASTGEAVKIIDQTLLSVLHEDVVPTRALWDRLAGMLQQAQEATR